MHLRDATRIIKMPYKNVDEAPGGRYHIQKVIDKIYYNQIIGYNK